MIKKDVSKYKMTSNNILYLIIVKTKFLRFTVKTKYYVAFEKDLDTESEYTEINEPLNIEQYIGKKPEPLYVRLWYLPWVVSLFSLVFSIVIHCIILYG